MQTISCQNYSALVDAGEPLTLLDVRNHDEYERGHMEDALLIPLHVLPLQYAEKLPDKDMKIVCCCAHGGRASQAAAFLVGQGYTDVVVLDGGYEGYCAQQA